MNFGEAGLGILRDHLFGAAHRLFRRQFAPHMRSQMIAAQNELALRQTRPRHQRLDEIAKSGRPHAGIAAILVDLIAGRFDQQQGAVIQRLLGGRPDHPGMRRTDRCDAALPVRRQQVQKAIACRQCPPRLLVCFISGCGFDAIILTKTGNKNGETWPPPQFDVTIAGEINLDLVLDGISGSDAGGARASGVRLSRHLGQFGGDPGAQSCGAGHAGRLCEPGGPGRIFQNGIVLSGGSQGRSFRRAR